ncbi:MAG: KEOPS complex subunit Pcc1 [Halobacteria archaeon]
MRPRLAARFLLQLPDARVVLRALRPEARSSPGASIALRRGALELRLQGTTPSGLRSQVNAWLRLVEVAAGAAAAAGPTRKV